MKVLSAIILLATCATASATDYYKCRGTDISLYASASSESGLGAYAIEFAGSNASLGFENCIRREIQYSFGTAISIQCLWSNKTYLSNLTLYPFNFGKSNVYGGSVEIIDESSPSHAPAVKNVNLACEVNKSPAQ